MTAIDANARMRDRGMTERTKIIVTGIITALAGGGAGSMATMKLTRPESVSPDQIASVIRSELSIAMAPIERRLANLETRNALNEAQIVSINSEIRPQLLDIGKSLTGISVAVAKIEERTKGH